MFISVKVVCSVLNWMRHRWHSAVGVGYGFPVEIDLGELFYRDCTERRVFRARRQKNTWCGWHDGFFFIVVEALKPKADAGATAYFRDRDCPTGSTKNEYAAAAANEVDTATAVPAIVASRPVWQICA